jgi:phage baseplate assembly protein W
MAYDGNTEKNFSNNSVTFKGFSSRAERQNFKVYDFECAKQDLINRLSVRKGERVENPEFGTIIYDALFEPLTEDLKDAIVEDVTENLNADPRIATEEILLTEADKGIAIQATIRYVPLDITEKLRFAFDENSLLRLS